MNILIHISEPLKGANSSPITAPISTISESTVMNVVVLSHLNEIDMMSLLCVMLLFCVYSFFLYREVL